jgi:hypothetical protein
VDREAVLAGLILLLCGPLVLICGALTAAPAIREDTSAGAIERRRWWRLWTPCLPAVLVGALLVGWALQEPRESDEAIRPAALGVILPLAILWARAGLRAGAAWLRTRPEGAAFTVGLLRPRVVVDPTFASGLEPEGLQAVIAHEQAHARHRDPLRIWLAQIATDLQWPGRAARARFKTWLSALELARDEEARARGADGGALAAAILTAVDRPARTGHPGPAAFVEGHPDGGSLRERIERLLAPMTAPPTDLASRSRLLTATLVVSVAAALAVGFAFGDVLVRAIPGVML